jgi:hypothetical protein
MLTKPACGDPVIRYAIEGWSTATTVKALSPAAFSAADDVADPVGGTAVDAVDAGEALLPVSEFPPQAARPTSAARDRTDRAHVVRSR